MLRVLLGDEFCYNERGLCIYLSNIIVNKKANLLKNKGEKLWGYGFIYDCQVAIEFLNFKWRFFQVGSTNISEVVYAR